MQVTPCRVPIRGDMIGVACLQVRQGELGGERDLGVTGGLNREINWECVRGLVP